MHFFYLIQSKLPNAQIIVTGLFTRSQRFSYFHQIVNDVNIMLGNACPLYQILFFKINDDWLQANGKLNPQLFWKDDLHLSKTGYQKFATSLFNFISLYNTSKSSSFDLRKIDKSFTPLSKTNIHIPTKKIVHLFKKHKFCKPKYIHKSFVHCLHVCEVSVPVPVTTICVISSPLLISANISKPVLVTASTVSVISDVTMQSVNVTRVPVCRCVSKNERKTFFYQHSTMLRSTVNACKLRVHCHDVCNINPPTYISVNCVEIPMNIIRSNVHKTVVSYKTVQSFCSDVVVQNVNVISSPTCKVLCFKKHHHVSQIKCFMLETSPFAVTSSTKLPSSSTLSPPSSLSSLSSSSSISTSSPSSSHHHHHHYH